MSKEKNELKSFIVSTLDHVFGEYKNSPKEFYVVSRIIADYVDANFIPCPVVE